MVLSLSSLSEPIGSIKSWLRANSTDPLPSGWLICDGSLLIDASSPFNGKNLPDLRGKFPRGHSTLDNASFPSDATYFAGGAGVEAGGADTVNLGHAHSSPSHSHSVSHNHSVSVPQHAHSQASYTSFISQTTGSTPGNQGIIGPGPGPIGHTHALSSTNQASIPSFNSGSYSGGTGSTGVTTNTSLGSTPNLPTYTGFVTIIKVK